MNIDTNIFQCPITKENLSYLKRQDIDQYVKNHQKRLNELDSLTGGLINESGTYFFPIFDEVFLLLPEYALEIKKNKDYNEKMSFDQERVFNYYNEINFTTHEGLKIYKDSNKWVDYREVSKDYIQKSFLKTKKYIKEKGKYFIDVGSGPIGLKEYIQLSDKYELRICIDISINALIQAKKNYKHKKGIFICGDITNIPLKENIGDAVISQHTLYHIPKNKQEIAVKELYRVAKPGSNVAIVYSWFYYSWFMNIGLFPIQAYRVVRHFAGKFYVKLIKNKPRLYFYAHRQKWFKKQFPFSNEIEFYCWRSTNKYFLNLYIHSWLGGRKLLQYLSKLENKYPRFFGRFGEYAVILVKKRKAYKQ